jgi:amylosucrase
MQDDSKAGDSRWIHRADMDWEKAQRRRQHGTVEHKIFCGLQHMISVRKGTPAFADFNNRELIETSNTHLFVFMRTNPQVAADRVLVVGNFDREEQDLALAEIGSLGRLEHQQLRDLISGAQPPISEDRITIPGYSIYWLSDRRS